MVSIQVGTSGRQLDGYDPRTLQDAVEALRVFGVSVMNQITGVGQFATDTGHIAGDLFNPSLVGRVGHSPQHNLTPLQMDEKEHVNGDQSAGRPDFGGKEVSGS
jgi:hypothetical protein